MVKYKKNMERGLASSPDPIIYHPLPENENTPMTAPSSVYAYVRGIHRIWKVQNLSYLIKISSTFNTMHAASFLQITVCGRVLLCSGVAIQVQA